MGRNNPDVVRKLFLDLVGPTGTVLSGRRDFPGLAVSDTSPENPFGLPERRSDAECRSSCDPACAFSLRYCAHHGATAVSQTIMGVGIVDAGRDPVLALEAALADVRIEAVR